MPEDLRVYLCAISSQAAYGTTMMQAWMVLESYVLANTVSLVPTQPDTPSAVPIWLSHTEWLAAGAAASKEHAHLLAAFYLHRNINCYVVVGAGIDGVDLPSGLYHHQRATLSHTRAVPQLHENWAVLRCTTSRQVRLVG
jgi:hypothetical protein